MLTDEDRTFFETFKQNQESLEELSKTTLFVWSVDRVIEVNKQTGKTRTSTSSMA